MNDKLICSDGTTVYVTLESQIKSWVKWMLIVLNVLLIPLISFFCYWAFTGLGVTFLFPSLLIGAAYVFIIFRPTLWNLYGREVILINQKSFSHQKDFGWFMTNLKTVDISNGVGLLSEDVLSFEENDTGLIHFYEYDEHDLPVWIYSTGIKTSKENFKEIGDLIEEINEVNHPSFWFSEN